MYRLFWVLAALAGAIGTASAKDYSSEMVYSVYVPCLGNASFCRPVILAQGEIDEEAARRLKSFLADLPGYVPDTIALDSPGGSLQAGLDIGRLIRAEGLSTIVAGEYEEERFVGDESAMIPIAKDVICFSACAYVFMGGISRDLKEGGRVGVHQFSGSGLSANEREASSQVAVATLSAFLLEMGVDRGILDVASLTDSSDMTVIPEKYAVQFNLDNQEPPLMPWKLEALDDGNMMLDVVQQKGGGDRKTLIGLTLDPTTKGQIDVFAIHGRNIQRDNAYLTAAVKDANSVPKLCAGEDLCVPSTVIDPWKFDTKLQAYTVRFRVSTDALLALSTREEQLQFDADFPPAFFLESPSVQLSREGFRNSLLAILRK